MASLLNPGEYANYLLEQQESHIEDAADLSRQNYYSLATVEQLIHKARGIYREHNIWEKIYLSS